MKEAQRREDLQILLNLFDDRIEVSYPIFKNFELFHSFPNSYGYKIKNRVFEEDFRELPKKRDIGEEIPCYSDYKNCFLTSGIIEHQNYSKFEEFYKMRKNTSSGKNPVFCPDTNLLYNCFLSNFDEIKSTQVRVVETVREELISSMNYKYENSEINSLKDLAQQKQYLLKEFRNGRKKKARKASYLGLRELKNLGGERIKPTEEGSTDTEKNDKIIAKSVQKFEKDNDVEAIVLTSDAQMRDVCEGYNLRNKYLEPPREVDENFCEHGEFLKLVTDLTLVFGFIKINSVILFGEYRGKGPDRPNSLKIKFLDDSLEPKFAKQKEIAHNLLDLEIEK